LGGEEKRKEGKEGKEGKETGEEGRERKGGEKREGKDDSWSLGDRRPCLDSFEIGSSLS